MELFTAFQDDKRGRSNQSFQQWVLDMVFNTTYKASNKEKNNKTFYIAKEEPNLMVADSKSDYTK